MIRRAGTDRTQGVRRAPAILASAALLSTLAACAVGGEQKPDRPRPMSGPPPEAAPPVPVGRSPVSVAVGEGAVWVANNAGGTVVRLDPATARPEGRPIAAGAAPVSVSVGEGAVWVADGGGSVRRIDPSRPNADGRPIPVEDPSALAAGAGAVWVTSSARDTVTVIDPATGAVAGEPIRVGDGPTDVAVGEGAVWVANSGDGTVTKIDPETRRPAGEPIAIARDQVFGLAVGEGGVWVVGSDDPLSGRVKVVRIEPGSGKAEEDPVALDGTVTTRLAAGLGAVWVTDPGSVLAATNERSPTVSRIDPPARAVAGRPVPVGQGPADIATGEGAVFVVNSGDGTVTRIEP